ncbi:YeiH family protein [Paucilactobacillus sp. N302-9]
MQAFGVLKTREFYFAALFTLICSLLGTFLGGLPYLSVIGALVLSLILGMVAQVAKPAIDSVKPGIGFISNKFLRLGIILLGFKLNLIDLAQAGVKTILLAIFIVTGTIIVTYNIARKFGVDPQLAILAASGTGICGAAAVMGISSQIQVTKEEVTKKNENDVLAVAIVAILGTVFTLIEIGIKPLLHMTPTQFGVMTGGSLHEIAHAVAAGSAGGPISLNTAIITKLSRVLMLAPAALIIGLWYQKNHSTVKNEGDTKLPIPWFMAGFIAASVIGTFVPLGAANLALLVKIAYIILGMAMAALGMSVNFRVILQRGKNVFLAAITSSVILLVCVIIASKLFF